MKRSTIFTLTGLLAWLPMFQLSGAIGQTAEDGNPAVAAQGVDELKKQSVGSQKIRFQFQESDWKDVIPWFAEQAGFSLQPINDWPEGTFYLKDDSEYTTLEALDQLNHALRMRTPPFTLIRNRNMLIMTQLENANFPNELIETVNPDDLDSRGKYEILSCVFDLGDLSGDTMYQELRPMVGKNNQDFFAVFPAANQIHVRETGGTLRDIRNLIDTAKRRLIGDNQSVHVYRLKNVDAETFMLIARGLLRMEPGRDFTDDGSLTISREPFGDRLFIRGTDKMQKLFNETAQVVDVPQDAEEGVEIAKLRFKNYSILVDPKLGYDLLQTVLEGTPARMQQDEVTGNITILGRDEDHLAVEEALAAIAGEGGESFEIIKLVNGDASQIQLAVQSLLRQTATAETVSGPVVMANPVLNQILVRGKPQEVREVTRMVADLDKNSLPVETGPRTGTRIINMDASDMDALTPSLLEDLFGETGRRNSLNIVLPDQRKDLNSRLRGLPEKSSELEDLEKFMQGEGVEPPPAKRVAPAEKQDSPRRDSRGSFNNRGRLFGSPSVVLLAHCVGVTSWLQTGLLVPSSLQVPQDETSSAKTSDEFARQNASDYRPIDAIPSVPGAPIDARFTDYGIVLNSEDLDALDDMEQAIRSRLDEDAETQLPTFFFLQFRKAENMKPFIEEFFGLADSGAGGGGGGAGGLMGGMMNNMLGGGAGDLLDGLMGGGGGGASGSGAGILEGEVRFGMDASFNSIYVAGATGGDLDQISQLIELLDKPDPPHNPDTIGEFRTIEIFHRDPEELKVLVEKQIPDFIATEKTEGGAAQNNEAAQMMKALAQLQGGKGGGAAAEEQEKPQARLGVDVTTNRLLVTGPDFIYQEILTIVKDLDVQQLSDSPTVTILQRQVNNQAVLDTLKAMFSDDIEIVESAAVDDNSESSADGTSKSPTATGSDATARAQQQQQQQMQQAREAFGRMMQQQGGGRGGPGGGGGGRGGANGGGAGGGRGGAGGGGGQPGGGGGQIPGFGGRGN